MPSNPIRLWKASDGKSPLCAEAATMVNKSLGDLSLDIREAFDYAALLGCDVEQFREEVKHLVESIETRNRP